MPGRLRRACYRKIAQHRAYDALVAIEAALLPHASEHDRKARVAYWKSIVNAGQPEQPANVVPFGRVVARSFDDLAAWLGKANRDMSGGAR